MTIAIFCHSLLSDWNHGNAHFLRGIITEMQRREWDVRVFEPEEGWSLAHLKAEHGEEPLRAFEQVYPTLKSIAYDLGSIDLEEALDGCDLVLVHEWNDHELVRRIGAYRRQHPDVRLLFHDTHHRAATEPESMSAYDLSGYDGVLAFGGAIRDLYLQRGWAERVWVWHEAADPRVFHPMPEVEKEGDLVWVGNWGDEERTAELHEYLLQPVEALGLRATVYGVRYPEHARKALHAAGITYGGWLPNFRAPDAFARHRATVHVPRRPYVEALPGIPTIRVFEALACGIPLVSSPWDDAEGLFTPGEDFLVAEDGVAMKRHLRDLVNDAALRASVAERGLGTVLARHTCAHRVDELEEIAAELGTPVLQRSTEG